MQRICRYLGITIAVAFYIALVAFIIYLIGLGIWKVICNGFIYNLQTIGYVLLGLLIFIVAMAILITLIAFVRTLIYWSDYNNSPDYKWKYCPFHKAFKVEFMSLLDFIL